MALSQRNKNIIGTAVITFLLLQFLVVLTLFSVFYQDIYGFPRTENGIMDFAGYDYEDSYVAGFMMQGEWEFFYNRWIVTDELNDAPDAMLKLPSVWTGIEVNGAKLPKSGYASYRATVSNLQAGVLINVFMYKSAVAGRVYINGELNSVSGRVSKNKSGTFSSGRVDESYPYTVAEGESLTVVVELSATANGGMFDPPVIKQSERVNLYDSFFKSFAYVVIGIIAAYTVFAVILNLGLYRKQKRFSSFALLLLVFLHLLSSKEVFQGIILFLPFISYALVQQISYISGILVIAAFVYHLLRERIIVMPKAGIYAMLASAVAFTSLYYILAGTVFQISAIILCVAALVYIFYLLSCSMGRKTKFSIISVWMLLFLSALVIAESLDNLGWLIFTMETPVSVILLMFVVCVTVMNFISIRDGAAKALSAVVLEKENELMKHQALRAQIKPHFIFNLLSSVQALYKKDTGSGDEALTKFASHLRQNIDADNNDLIPFEQEIENITNYVELENLRRSKKVTLLFDIDFAEFEVPVLSLQPLVENAIKYAGTDEKEDGYIRITSARTDGHIIITVSDNGSGFDTSAVRRNAAGLKNCEGRLKYLLNAEMTVVSAIGSGTTVTVRIP